MMGIKELIPGSGDDGDGSHDDKSGCECGMVIHLKIKVVYSFSGLTAFI